MPQYSSRYRIASITLVARHGDPTGEPLAAPSLDGVPLALVTGKDHQLATAEIPLSGRDAGALSLAGGHGRYSARVIAEIDRRSQRPAAQGMRLARR